MTRSHSLLGFIALAGCAADAGLGPSDDCGTEGCVSVDDGDGESTSAPDPDGDADGDAEPATDDAEPVDPAPGGVPCDVLDVLRGACHECHGDAPAFGAPMPLVDHDDFLVPATSDGSRPVHELVAERLVDEAEPMPPDGSLGDADRDLLLAWLAAGAPEDPAADCGEAPPDDTPAVGPDALPCDADLVLTAHAGDGATGYHVPAQGADNLYMCFAFQAPFDVETQATAWAPIIDDERVVHHWILYRTKQPQPDGGAFPCDVSLQVSADFVAGWAPGGGNVMMPEDVGLELGEPGDWYVLQLHYNNSAHHADAIDRSGVAFCTIDEPRTHTAGVLTLGSVAIDIPPGAEDHEVTGTCSPLSTLFWPEMHLLAASPHMHELGRAMKSEVRHLDGTTETLVDVPVFDFHGQGSYPVEPEIVVKPGDSITTTCTYDNPGDQHVLFGEGTDDEMCFNFVFGYPIEGLYERNCGIL
jgi:hypothetical protein